ncbi:heterokaryon incompatibility protein-domain-containing protein, partial [Paraphoma chrysanthemicola]
MCPDSATPPESLDPAHDVPRTHLCSEPALDERVGSLGAGQEDTHSYQQSKYIPRYVTQTREWIEACKEEHGSACVLEPILQRPPDDVPRWLIDTQQQCIVPGVSANQYLALSYVWPETRGSVDSNGLPPRTLLLDNESIADFQQPGFLAKEDIVDRIPAVIHHAMRFTLALCERYLWVDRLCIVQNDVGDGGTLSQVAKMDKIYAGAYLTIIAAAMDKMYERENTAEWPIFESKRRMRSIYTERSIADYASGKSTTSRWATRGWTYQEQILCKRAVVLVDWGFFWDCQCSIWDGVDLVPGQEFDGVQLRADMGQRFATKWWPDFGFYLDLICPYNGREFSYPQDALLGISGVLNALGESFPGGFIHGLPRLFLDHALLWQPFGTAEQRLDRRADEEIRTSLPSWSWAGWQCYVDPWSLRSGLSYSNDKESRW